MFAFALVIHWSWHRSIEAVCSMGKVINRPSSGHKMGVQVITATAVYSVCQGQGALVEVRWPGETNLPASESRSGRTSGILGLHRR
jgi:hypothetical protein